MKSTKNKDSTEEPESISEVTQDVKERMDGLLESIQSFFHSVISIRGEIDYKGAPKRIAEDAKFQGFNVWVLIFSIFIASIGLNANSTAIIIGAMLISPLMGPIVGIGFSLGTNRFRLLKHAFLSYVLMVIVALVTSSLYFCITPLDQADTEILTRTSPTILDVLVAIFGGLAGSIEGMRKNTGLTVIPGVAIATALMPPLCTVGYGIATLQPEFAFGAMYLFLLNSVMISVATMVFVRFSRFPLQDYINKKKDRSVKIWIYIFTAVLIVPSIWFFISATRKSMYESKANLFITEVIHQPKSFVISKKVTYQTDSIPRIEILIGGKTIADTTINSWNKKLKDYQIPSTHLVIIQDVHDQELSAIIQDLKQNSTTQAEQNKTLLNAVLADKETENFRKDSIINSLAREISKRDLISYDYQQISTELNVMFNGITHLGFGEVEVVKDDSIRIVPALFIQWNQNVSSSSQKMFTNQIQDWLPVRTHDSTIVVRQYLP
tara:strand:+ start:51780 stop:53261 length:1482 start_codon:yes stop_codon:yes gene_type:complete